MAKIHNNTAARNAKEEYKAYVTAIENEFFETFLPDSELQVKHSEAEKKALEHFYKYQMRDEEYNSAMVLMDLKKVSNLFFKLV